MMKRILFFLGCVWTLPNSIFGWLFLAFLAATRQVDGFGIQSDFTFLINLKNGGWFCKRSMTEKGWLGFAIGNCIFVVDTEGDEWGRTILHENTHCRQAYVLGVLFYPFYILESVRIWLFVKEEHSYYDNEFEIQARKAAGQSVKIPKSMWADPNDRWIWW